VVDEGSVEADATRACSKGYIASHQLNGSRDASESPNMVLLILKSVTLSMHFSVDAQTHEYFREDDQQTTPWLACTV
jgi:hypothetical protein